MKAWTMAAIALLAGGLALAQRPPAPTTRPYTAHTYADAVRELRTRGFPATLADLQSPALPDDQNAAVLLIRAADMFIPEDCSPRSSSIEYGPALPYSQEWFELAERSIVSHAELLKAVRQARSCPAISWNPTMVGKPSDWMSATLPTFSGQRALANTVADAALLEHFKGNDAEALEYARDLIFIADANARRPFHVSHLVATGIRAMAADTLLLIGTELRVADARKPSGAVTGHEATRQQCKEMIGCLLEDAFFAEEQRRVMLEERVYALNDMDANKLLVADYWRQLLPQFLELYDCVAAGAPTDHLNAVTSQPLIKTVADSYARNAQTRRQLQMYRAAAAVALATRMYEEDHGAYPADLKALVPDYLPHIPIDPYSPTAAPILYRPGKRPMVGSAGPDGINAHLPSPPKPNYNTKRPKPGEPDDQWIDLTAWR